MTFYSIKYLETHGLEQFEGTISNDVAGDRTSGRTYASTHPEKSARKDSRFYFGRFERIDRDCFTSRATAVEMGKDRLTRKIEALRKQRVKLETMRMELA